jgi:hypothetical protein
MAKFFDMFKGHSLFVFIHIKYFSYERSKLKNTNVAFWATLKGFEGHIWPALPRRAALGYF